MSQSETAPVENVARGALLTLLIIPAAIILFALIGGFLGLISGFVVVAIPFAANFLYVKGAGAPLSRAGWMPFILITGAAVVLGMLTSIISATFNGFLAVGGKGGLLGRSFRTTLGYQFTQNFDDLLFPVLIGLLLGLGGIVSVVRGKNMQQTAAPTPAAWPADQQPAAPAANWQAPQQGAVPPVAAQVPQPGETPAWQPPQQAAVPPAAAPTPAPVRLPNQPSPGIMLNGKPLDGDKKRK